MFEESQLIERIQSALQMTVLAMEKNNPAATEYRRACSVYHAIVPYLPQAMKPEEITHSLK